MPAADHSSQTRTFTQANQVRGLKPEARPFEVRDAFSPKHKGLVLRVQPTGNRSWWFVYKVDGTRCPCCAARIVLDDAGSVIEAEYDHFYSRERNSFEDTWLICVPCHKRLTIGGERAQVNDAFNVYQGRAGRLPGVGTIDWIDSERKCRDSLQSQNTVEYN